MYKKKLAMDHSNENIAEEVTNPPEVQESNGEPQLDSSKENGDKSHKKRQPAKKKKIAVKIGKNKKRKTNGANIPGPDEDGEYEVEAIVDHKKEKGKTLYRVRWKGYSMNQDTWEAATNLTCKDLLTKYKKKITKENKDTYAVSKIIDHRRYKGTVYYLIRWENYSPKDDSWQPKESLNCNQLLKEYHDNLNEEIFQREVQKLKARNEAKASNNEYEVEAILDSKIVKGKTKYLIRWKGWDESDDTWEPEETLNCPDLIKAFNKKGKNSKKAKAAPKKRKRKYDSDASNDDSDDSDYADGNRKKEYEVFRILNSRINKAGKWDFFVMWKGWGPEHNTWEPEEHLSCPKLINDFLGKNTIPRNVQARLEKLIAGEVSTVKAKRKPPSERAVHNSGGLRGRTKGELKVFNASF